MSAAESAYWVAEAIRSWIALLLTVLVLFLALLWLRTLARKSGVGGRDWSIMEWLPGNAGRRARVERHHLKIRGRHYKRRTARPKVAWFFWDSGVKP